MSKRLNHLYEFGEFRLDPSERLLLHEGRPVPLTPKAFETLLVLIQRSGHVVKKSELMKEVWADVSVEEANLARNIWTLRKALRDDESGHRYIETIPKLGYRFIAPVRELPNETIDVLVHRRVRARIIDEEEESSDNSEPQLENEDTRAGSAILSLCEGTVSATRTKTLRRSRPIVLAVGGLLALTAIGVLLWGSSHRAPQPAMRTSIKSIAVLPLKLLDTGENYLGLGIADTVIRRLGQSGELIVRPTSAVSRYMNGDTDALTAARQLGVDSVLEGTVQREGDRIRVSVQFVDANEGKTLWARKFDEQFTDIFAVEDAISEQIVLNVTPELIEDQRTRSAKHYTQDPQAHELYLQGRFNLNKFTEDGTRLARQYFQQAIERDPKYALAYAGLAESFAFGEIGLSPAEAFPKARETATRALEIDETLGEAHAALAQVAFLWDWDWLDAERQFKRAVELAPGDTEIHHMYAHFLSAMGRFDDALGESRRLLELDPLSPASRNHLGWNYLYAHQFDQAIEQYKLVLAVDPNFAEAHRQLGDAYAEEGRFDESVEETLRRFELVDRGSDVPALRKAYSTLGWRGFWQKRLQIAAERSKHTYMSPSGTASIYAELGDTPRVLDWLERAYREHDHDLVYLKVDHTWDSVRSEPRFRELLKRMQLET